MNTNKNSYTFIYASVLVVIVAFLLAFVSSALKPQQAKNIELDKKKQILAALNVFDVKDAKTEYDKYVKGEELWNVAGQKVAETGAFQVESKDITDEKLPLYICNVDDSVKYVIPLYGAGLWGPIWGYVALNADKNTVFGVYFSHASETPGLGAEITNREKFQTQFYDKLVMNKGKVAISVLKHGKADHSSPYELDGISGGTITSKGVDAMLKSCLSKYTAFLTAADVNAVAEEATEKVMESIQNNE